MRYRQDLPSDFCWYQIIFDFNIVAKAQESAFFSFPKPANHAEKKEYKQQSPAKSVYHCETFAFLQIDHYEEIEENADSGIPAT